MSALTSPCMSHSAASATPRGHRGRCTGGVDGVANIGRDLRRRDARASGSHLAKGTKGIDPTQVQQLVTAIRTFIDGWNDRCHPFVWTKTTDEILPHATRQPTSDARH